MVAGALKSSVRVVSGGIEKATDALEGVVPDNVGRGTVRIAAQTPAPSPRCPCGNALHVLAQIPRQRQPSRYVDGAT